MNAFLFFLFASVAIAAAVLVIVHRNPVYSALSLILTLFALAGLYVLLQAPFIAAIHIIVYAGAIMVLFLFVIMLLDLKKDEKKEGGNKLGPILGIAAAVILVVEIFFFITSTRSPAASGAPMNSITGDTQSIGLLLFTRYLFPFEIASVLLLSAIIGSIVLAKLKLRT